MCLACTAWVAQPLSYAEIRSVARAIKSTSFWSHRNGYRQMSVHCLSLLSAPRMHITSHAFFAGFIRSYLVFVVTAPFIHRCLPPGICCWGLHLERHPLPPPSPLASYKDLSRSYIPYLCLWHSITVATAVRLSASPSHRL